MFGKIFQCCKCEHSYRAGITNILETDTLPEARFYSTNDEQGLWVCHDGKNYCGKCSELEFPKITEPDVKLTVTGRICF